VANVLGLRRKQEREQEQEQEQEQAAESFVSAHLIVIRFQLNTLNSMTINNRQNDH
jgi:hypothetical protein